MKAFTLVLIAGLAMVACGKTERPHRFPRSLQEPNGKARVQSANDELLGTWIAKCEKINNGRISGKGKITFKPDGTTSSHTEIYVSPNCIGHAFYKADIEGTYEANLAEDKDQKLVSGQVKLLFTETAKTPGGKGLANVVIKNSKLEAHMVERVLIRNGKETPIERKDLTDFTLRKVN